MAKREHVRLARDGSEAIASIARWQSQHPGEHLDLSYARLIGAYLSGANLIRANLSGADLSYASLNGADLSGANLIGAHLSWAHLSWAHLSWADLSGADLSYASLNGADLSGANLIRANLSWADLPGANLSGANLLEAYLAGADLRNANLTGARCGFTTFAICNLGRCLGLESVVHNTPSSIGIDTIMVSKGGIPRAFLLGAGVPKEILDALLSLVSGERRYYHCFIRYTSADEEFATRLHRDLTTEGVLCWKYDHGGRGNFEDEEAGRAVWFNISREAQKNVKMVTICSQSSLQQRDGVPREIELALQKEADLKAENVRRQGEAEKPGGKPDLLDEDVLVPVRLDSFVLNEWQHERKADVRAKHIGDFSEWRTEAKYQGALNRLLHALDPKTWGPA